MANLDILNDNPGSTVEHAVYVSACGKLVRENGSNANLLMIPPRGINGAPIYTLLSLHSCASDSMGMGATIESTCLTLHLQHEVAIISFPAGPWFLVGLLYQWSPPRTRQKQFAIALSLQVHFRLHSLMSIMLYHRMPLGCFII